MADFSKLVRSFFQQDVSDKIIYNDEVLYMTYSPLTQHPSDITIMWDYIIDSFNNPVLYCVRGHIATWKIIDNKLYLVDIEGGTMTVRNRENFLESRRALKKKLKDGLLTHQEYPDLKIYMEMDSKELIDVNFNNLSPTGAPIFMDRFNGHIKVGMGKTIDRYDITPKDEIPVVDFNGPLTPRGFVLSGYRGSYTDCYNYIIDNLLYEKYITLTFENGEIVDTNIQVTSHEIIETLCEPPPSQVDGEPDIVHQARMIVWKHNYEMSTPHVHRGYGWN